MVTYRVTTVTYRVTTVTYRLTTVTYTVTMVTYRVTTVTYTVTTVTYRVTMVTYRVTMVTYRVITVTYTVTTVTYTVTMVTYRVTTVTHTVTMVTYRVTMVTSRPDSEECKEVTNPCPGPPPLEVTPVLLYTLWGSAENTPALDHRPLRPQGEPEDRGTSSPVTHTLVWAGGLIWMVIRAKHLHNREENIPTTTNTTTVYNNI